MKTNKKRVVIPGLIALIIILFGYVIIHNIYPNFGNRNTTDQKISSIKNNVPTDTVQSTFFAELLRNMNAYQEGSQIVIQPISFENNIAIIQYANSQETFKFLAINFNNNEIFQTNFISSPGNEFIPMFIVDSNKLVAYKKDEDNNLEIDLTDIQGNVIKTLKQFTVTDSQKDFSYDTQFGKNIILIFEKPYIVDQNDNLVPAN